MVSWLMALSALKGAVCIISVLPNIEKLRWLSDHHDAC